MIDELEIALENAQIEGPKKSCSLHANHPIPTVCGKCGSPEWIAYGGMMLVMPNVPEALCTVMWECPKCGSDDYVCYICYRTRFAPIEELEFYQDPEFRRRYLMEEHKCTLVTTFQDQMFDEGRGHWWLGKLDEELSGLPGERWCLHAKTVLKEFVLILDEQADAAMFAVMAAFMLGQPFDKDWIQNSLNGLKKGIPMYHIDQRTKGEEE